MTAPWIDQLENTNINPLATEFFLKIDDTFILLIDNTFKLVIEDNIGPVTPIWTDQIEA